MPQFLVRNVSASTAAALRSRAARNGRSVESEHRALLDEALAPPAFEAWSAELDRLRDETRGRGGPTAVEILREDRGSR